MTKLLKKQYDPVPVLHSQNTTAITDKQKANLLAEHFEQAHVIERSNTTAQEAVVDEVRSFVKLNNTCENQIKGLLTSPKKIAKIINCLSPFKAPGPDGIQNMLLKHLTKKAVIQLTHIINAIIKLSYFPQAWKIAHVIHKTGKIKT